MNAIAMATLDAIGCLRRLAPHLTFRPLTTPADPWHFDLLAWRPCPPGDSPLDRFVASRPDAAYVVVRRPHAKLRLLGLSFRRPGGAAADGPTRVWLRYWRANGWLRTHPAIHGRDAYGRLHPRDFPPLGCSVYRCATVLHVARRRRRRAAAVATCFDLADAASLEPALRTALAVLERSWTVRWRGRREPFSGRECAALLIELDADNAWTDYDQRRP